MTQFSPNEIAGLIYFVGGWGPNKIKPIDVAGKNRVINWLDIAIGVCLAESGGVVEAVNGTGTNTVVGLWQIKPSVHLTIVALAGLTYGGKPLSHPLVNTRSARDVYREAELAGHVGWNPWTTYTSGAYKAHKGHGAAAYDWLHNKDNITAFKAKLASLGYPIVSITAEDIANSDSMINGGLVKSNLGEQADKIKNSVSSQVDKVLSALKESGIVVGVFVLGAILLILGVLFMAQRTGVAKSVPGPIGLVAKAVKK